MLKKIVFILSIVASIKLLTSCFILCSCPEPIEVEIDFNKIQFDYEYYDRNYDKTDSIFPENLTFKVLLLDTQFYNGDYLVQDLNSKLHASPFIKSAFACSCVFERYRSSNLSHIEVTNLAPLNNFEAFSNVSEIFLLKSDLWYDQTRLYYNLETGIEMFNSTFPIYHPDYSINFYSKERIENDSCRFILNFYFENNQCVKDTTAWIHINH